MTLIQAVLMLLAVSCPLTLSANNSLVQQISIKAFDPEDCFLPPAIGTCKALFPRYYFDFNDGTCKNFTYGGCNGTSNNFASEIDCLSSCGDPDAPVNRNLPTNNNNNVPSDIPSDNSDSTTTTTTTTTSPINNFRCLLPPISCSARNKGARKFFYNATLDLCQNFQYCGTLTSGILVNMFDDLASCLDICALTPSSTTTTTTTTTASTSASTANRTSTIWSWSNRNVTSNATRAYPARNTTQPGANSTTGVTKTRPAAANSTTTTTAGTKKTASPVTTTTTTTTTPSPPADQPLLIVSGFSFLPYSCSPNVTSPDILVGIDECAGFCLAMPKSSCQAFMISPRSSNCKLVRDCSRTFPAVPGQLTYRRSQ